jgi:hypothetical protein
MGGVCADRPEQHREFVDTVDRPSDHRIDEQQYAVQRVGRDPKHFGDHDHRLAQRIVHDPARQRRRDAEAALKRAHERVRLVRQRRCLDLTRSGPGVGRRNHSSRGRCIGEIDQDQAAFRRARGKEQLAQLGGQGRILHRRIRLVGIGSEPAQNGCGNQWIG